MPNQQETEIERRYRQLEVIEKKRYAAEVRGQTDKVAECEQSLRETEARIAELRESGAPAPKPRRSRREG